MLKTIQEDLEGDPKENYLYMKTILMMLPVEVVVVCKFSVLFWSKPFPSGLRFGQPNETTVLSLLK